MSRETDYMLMGIQYFIKAAFHTSKKRIDYLVSNIGAIVIHLEK